jgi:hypothetical protein
MKYCVGGACKNKDNRIVNLCCNDCKRKNCNALDGIMCRDVKKEECEFYCETAKIIRFEKENIE